MKIILLISLFVGTALAATTVKPHVTHHHRSHGTHGTHEPPVYESFNFRYDPHSHLMVAIVKHKCYIYSMSGTESTDVHTSHGLHTLETKLINMVDDTSMTYKTMSHDDVTAASKSFAHTCNRQGFTSYKLN